MSVAQSCPTLSVHGIIQARKLEWVAIPSPGDLLNSRIKPGLRYKSPKSSSWGDESTEGVTRVCDLEQGGTCLCISEIHKRPKSFVFGRKYM